MSFKAGIILGLIGDSGKNAQTCAAGTRMVLWEAHYREEAELHIEPSRLPG
jgi:hypothetical protein